MADSFPPVTSTGKPTEMNQCETGWKAEREAASYLRARRYYIWKSNWRWGKKELDLVTIDGPELVIVEVKARVGNPVNLPWEVVDQAKQRNIVLATDAFIRLFDCHRPTRFDVIGVNYHSAGIEIEHIKNAFYPSVEFR